MLESYNIADGNTARETYLHSSGSKQRHSQHPSDQILQSLQDAPLKSWSRC